MRFLYHNWRPTRFGQFVDRLNCWWAGRKSGRTRSNPVAIATVEGKQYLVCILGQDSDWVWSVEAAHGDATIHPGTPTAPSSCRRAAGRASTCSSRVRANRAKRPTTFPAWRWIDFVRLRSDRRALSCVPDRSPPKLQARQTALFGSGE